MLRKKTKIVLRQLLRLRLPWLTGWKEQSWAVCRVEVVVVYYFLDPLPILYLVLKVSLEVPLVLLRPMTADSMESTEVSSGVILTTQRIANERTSQAALC